MKLILVINVLLLSFITSNNAQLVDVAHNYGNISSIREILEIFSIEYVGSEWMNLHNLMSRSCSDDMTKYLNGLSQKKVWSIKSKQISYEMQIRRNNTIYFIEIEV